MSPRTDSPASMTEPFVAPSAEAAESASCGAESCACDGPSVRPLGPSTPMGAIVAASVAAHLAIGWALGALGILVPTAPLEADVMMTIDVPFEVQPAPEPPPPAALPPEPPPSPELARVAPSAPVPRPMEPPPVAEAEPPPPAPAAPPSLDDVFGPPPEVMTAEGPGTSFAMSAGEPGGVPGGREGGVVGGTGHGEPSIAAAPTGPTEADRRRARRAYVRSLEGMLRGRTEYPRRAQRDQLEGRVELCFRVGADGRVLSQRVCGSAGHAILDEAAAAGAATLTRLPAPPELAAWSESEEIHAGIQFAIR